jgi:asparagine synthase (glutamine-hydrolysing)
MCGISGIWGDVDAGRLVGVMVGAMHHRGPDDCGVFAEGRIALGMTRLAIIDTSVGGHQPMQNASGTVSIIYNGELYNFRSERRILEELGHTFSSSSDTEVVLRMYEHYGDDFLKRLRGMFALAIYDRRRGAGRERLLLARDQMGIKPLLYARVKGGKLVFASEIKALLASGLVEPEIDPVALRLLLTFGSINQPRTILKGVEMLLPAHRLILEAGREGEQSVERFWSLGLNRYADLRDKPYEESVETVAAVIEESVRLQLTSDVPLGAFLSGGVDSSLLVAMMSRLVNHPVRTFSVGFAAEGSGMDETDEAEKTARSLGTEHTRVVVEGGEVRDRIRHIAAALDQPSVDGVNAYFVSMAARRGVTVAISGTGGDELFAGYPWFMRMALDETHRRAEPWKALAKSFIAAIARQSAFDPLLLKRGGWRLDRARECAGFVNRYASNHQIFSPAAAARLLTPPWRKSAQAGRSPHYDFSAIDELADGSAVERVAGLSLRGYMNNQLLRDIDAVSMSHSLEVRVPFIDPVVADVALSLPDSAKLGAVGELNGASEQSSYAETGAKRILIDIRRRLLASDAAAQPKRGFGMPFDSWLKNQLRDVLQDTLSPQSVRRRGIFDEAQVGVVRENFLSGRTSWIQPWLLMIVELWCREVLDSRSLNVRQVA